jgi:HEAT repeat protein/predicted MFS family arabinose efflux permease
VLRKALRLHPGEGTTVALAVGVAFLADAGIMIAQSSIDALFFARYGADKLPVLYLVVGVAMFATTVGLTRLLARVGRERAFVVIPVAICFTALAARAALETHVDWMYGVLWVTQSVAEFTGLLALWGLAGLIADTRQAKRFFPLISAGGVVGLVGGGLATGPLAAAFGSENLLLVWAALIGGAAVLAWRLVSRQARRPSARRRGRPEGIAAALTSVRKSPLLRWLSVGALLLSLLSSLLYLPFSAAAAERYPDPDELAGFFGTFFAVSMGTALVVSLLVTSRLLARFGVPAVVLVLPVLYLVAFGVLVVAASFATLAAFRFAQISWRSGGATSTWEALVNTVPPDRRDRVRAFLTGVPAQLGTMLAGVVALAAQALDEPRVLYGAALAGAALAVTSISRIRVAYPRALVAALREGRPTIFGSPGGPRPVALDADAVGLAVLNELLEDHEPTARLLAAQALGDLDLPESARALGHSLADRDADVRLAALTSLERVDPHRARDAAARLVSDADARVRRFAVGVLTRAGTPPPERLLSDPDNSVRGAAAAALLERSAEARSVLIAMTTSADVQVRAAAYRAMGTVGAGDGTEAVEQLVDVLGDHDAAVRAAAAEALGRIGSSAVEPVIDALFDPLREEGALGALERLALDGREGSVREFASAAVARALRDAAIVDGLGGARDDAVALVRDSLRAREQRSVRAALRAAALLGDRVSVSAALDSLDVSDRGQHATALEVIETVGEPGVVRPLLSLWELRPADAVDSETIERLCEDSDAWIRKCAAFAVSARKGGVMTHTLSATIPLVERVILLRRVPLFAPLPPDELQPIANVAEEAMFAEGELLAALGEHGDTMFVIVKGQVAVLGTDDAVIVTRGPGDFIGEMALISSQPRNATLRAETDVRVLEIRKPEFEAILRERPDTALALMRVLCNRLVDAGVTGKTELEGARGASS